MVRPLREPGSERRVEISRADGSWCGRFFAMGSPCEVLVDCDSGSDACDLARLAAAEAWRIEDKFSRYRSGNIVAAINAADGRPISVDDETARLIDFAAALYTESDGRFDITSGVLRRAWKFDGSSRVPSADTVAALRELVGWHRVAWRSPILEMPAGMQIDFGGIGKEYAVDRALACLVAETQLPALVNFGGDLAVTGAPRKRAAWRVGIEALQEQAPRPAKLIRLESGALATSGDSRRFLVAGNRRLGHILDPKTGWPVPDAPASVTVAADSCVQAGVYTTLAMLHGKGAEAFLEGEGVRHWLVRQ